MKKLFLLLLIILPLTMFGQLETESTITGTVMDTEMNEPLIGASVFIEGTTIGTSTDFDGKYEIKVAPGIYNLIVSYVGYDDKRIENLNDQKGQNLTLDIEVGGSAKDLDIGVVVTAKKNNESEAVQLLERKEATQLTQNIGSQELSKKGASNAADGLKKVVGLSVVGNKFVVVRGMGDRYNNATLNTLPVASPDPDKKVLPLNIFPTDVIQSMAVVKAFSPNLYGDFAGGNIDIRTKDYPDEPTLKVGTGIGFNTNVNYKNFNSYGGGLKPFDASVNMFNNSLFDGDATMPEFTSSLNPQSGSTFLPVNFNILYGDFIKKNKDGNNDSGFGYMISANYASGVASEAGKFK